MFSTKVILLLALVLFLLGSALAVVFNKYESRSLFIAIQKQEKLLDFYEVEWGLLQLELTTKTDEGRVERLAKEQLNLVLPERKKIIYLKP